MRNVTRTRILIATVLTVIVICGAGLLYIVPGLKMFLPGNTAVAQIVADPNYPALQKRIVRNNSDSSLVEYPVTGDPKLDSSISQVVDHYASDVQGHDGGVSTDGDKTIRKVLAEVLYLNDDVLSVSLTGQRQHGETTVSAPTRLMTFSRSAAAPLTREAFLQPDPESVSGYQAFLRGQLLNRMSELGAVSDLDREAIRKQEFTEFAFSDKATVSFSFSMASTPESQLRGMTLTIPADRLRPYLAPQVAQSVFHIDPGAPQASPINCTRNCVAITYDDGPDPLTPNILDTLKKHGAHATFFTIGNKVSSHPEIVNRELAEGHEIGNHSWSHPKLSTLSGPQISSQLAQTNQALEKTTGTKPHLLRPPYGAMNSAVTAEAGKQGMAVTTWSLDTKDWLDRDSQTVCTRAVEGAKDGSIILMHDIHKTTADATPCVVEGLQERGFTLVTVSELLGPQASPGTVHSRK